MLKPERDPAARSHVCNGALVCLTRLDIVTAAAILFGVLPFLQSGVSSQSPPRTVSIDPQIHCTSCDLRVLRQTTLGSLDKIVGNTVYLPMDAYSRFYVAVPEDPGHITIYDRNGNKVRTIGRTGRGPAEFTGLMRPFSGPQNTLYVFDSGANRFTVFDTSGTRIREHQIPRGIQRVVIFSDGSFAANGDLRGSSSIGYPVHYFSPSGTLLRSFGTDLPMRAPGLDSRLVRRMVAAGDSLLWVVSEADYLLELWNVKNGKLLKRLRRSVHWFPKEAGRDDVTPQKPPKPFIQALQIDPVGRLWVLISVADSRWRANISKRRSSPGEGVSYEMNLPYVWDTIVEVIDPVTARLIFSKRFDPFIRGFSRSDHVFSFRQDDSGAGLLDVWSITLTRKESLQ